MIGWLWFPIRMAAVDLLLWMSWVVVVRLRRMIGWSVFREGMRRPVIRKLVNGCLGLVESLFTLMESLFTLMESRYRFLVDGFSFME